MMKQIIPSIFLITILTICSCTGNIKFKKMDEEEKPIKDFKTELQDQKIDYAHNKYTLLNFWEPYCVPCIKEMPLLDSLQSLCNSNTMYLVCEADSASAYKVENFKNSKLKKVVSSSMYQSIIDNSKSFVKQTTIPMTVIIDSNLNEVYKLTGAIEPESFEEIKAIICAK